MSDSDSKVTIHLGGFFFVLFIAIKLVGTSLASWSWWWLLLPIVPVCGLIVQRLGL